MLRKYITKLIDEHLNRPIPLSSINKYSNTVEMEECEQIEEDTISFSLTPAVGGRILRSTRRNRHGDCEHQIYVIPAGEDVGERVAKILNLELLK